MKKTIALLLCLCMLACLFVGCASTSTTEKPTSETTTTETTTTETTASQTTTAASGNKVLKVGIFEPLTGDNGAGGKQETLGAQYGNFVQPTIEIGGETYDIQLEIVDNRTTAENGPSAASELVNRGVSVVLGSYGSGVSMAGGKVFEEAGIPAIGIGCTNPQVTSDCSVYFRVCFLDPFQGTVHANYACKDLRAKTPSSLPKLGSDNDKVLGYYFTEAFKGLGGEVVSEDFPEGNANFVSYINNAMADGADVIFCPVSTNYAQLIIEAAAAQGFKGAILGTDTVDNNMVLESAKGKDVRLLVTTFYQEGGSPEFDEGIKKWLNENPDMLTNNGGNDIVAGVTAMGYDAYFTALEAVKAADSTDPAAILAALPGVHYEGVTGVIEFDDIGDAKRDAAYIKEANTETGAWEFVAVQTVEQ